MVRAADRWGVPLTDPVALKALAHPARLRMLEVLREEDGATATRCSAVVGLSPSSCSWHLRLLHRAGLVEDAGAGPDGRERRWRSRVPSWQVEREAIDAEPAEARAVDVALTAALLDASDEAVRAFHVAAAQGREADEWRRASMVSNTALHLTAAELAELTERIRDLLVPYTGRRLAELPPDARAVHAALRFVPRAEPPAT